jgi:hypothetical protein
MVFWRDSFGTFVLTGRRLSWSILLPALLVFRLTGQILYLILMGGGMFLFFNTTWNKIPDSSIHWYPPVNSYLT